MQINEFIEATGRLEKYYGKEYSKEQMKIMHEELQHLEIDRYKFLISLAIRKCKFLPKIVDFMEIDKQNPNKTIQDKKEKVLCQKCNSTGYIIYNKKIPNGERVLEYPYVAICDCGNNKQYKGWGISDQEHKSDYYTPFAKQLGLI